MCLLSALKSDLSQCIPVTTALAMRMHYLGHSNQYYLTSSGLSYSIFIGQFWNATVQLQKHNGDFELRNRNQNPQDFVVLKFLNQDGSIRKTVGGIMGSRPWESTEESCVYAGDSEGGQMYEILKPNVSLLDGSYEDYIVEDLFGTEFKFSQFLRDAGSCSY